MSEEMMDSSDLKKEVPKVVKARDTFRREDNICGITSCACMEFASEHASDCRACVIPTATVLMQIRDVLAAKGAEKDDE